MSEYLKDRYCTCKTLCVWIPMDGPNRVWSIPPRSYQPYCPTCKIIVNKYCEKDEDRALVLTPKVSFEIFKENEALKAETARLRKALEAALAAKDARIDELEIALRDIAKGCYDAEGCAAIAKQVLEKT